MYNIITAEELEILNKKNKLYEHSEKGYIDFVYGGYFDNIDSLPTIEEGFNPKAGWFIFCSNYKVYIYNGEEWLDKDIYFPKAKFRLEI